MVPLSISWLLSKDAIKEDSSKANGEYTVYDTIDTKVYKDSDTK